MQFQELEGSSHFLCIHGSSGHRVRPNIAHDNTENPAIDDKEQYARQPQAWHKRRIAEKLQFKALLQPESLSEYPQCQSNEPKPGSAEHGGRWQVEWQEDHVPEEILLSISLCNNVWTMTIRTWLVQTLLNVTNANVCANIVPARSFFAIK